MKLYILFLIFLLISKPALADSDKQLCAIHSTTYDAEGVARVTLEPQGSLTYTDESDRDFSCKHYEINYEKDDTGFWCPEEIKLVILNAPNPEGWFSNGATISSINFQVIHYQIVCVPL